MAVTALYDEGGILPAGLLTVANTTSAPERLLPLPSTAAQYECGFCGRGQCARCSDKRCTCCGGNPDDDLPSRGAQPGPLAVLTRTRWR
jgi:hypothetical protein